MKIPSLRDFTSARVALGRSGNALPTAELLKLQLAHARAREAVHSRLNVERIAEDVRAIAGEVLFARSAAPDRVTYLRRPDLGRRLDDASREMLLARRDRFDAVFVIADGLSAEAVDLHAEGMCAAAVRLLSPSDWRLGPVVIVEQGRVAIGDEIGDCLGAALSIVLIGERPGLSASDSLGIYSTWNPRPGRTDAERNCISNIREQGLSYEIAAHKLCFLMNESRRRKLSGVDLKENAELPGANPTLSAWDG